MRPKCRCIFAESTTQMYVLLLIRRSFHCRIPTVCVYAIHCMDSKYRILYWQNKFPPPRATQCTKRVNMIPKLLLVNVWKAFDSFGEYPNQQNKPHLVTSNYLQQCVCSALSGTHFEKRWRSLSVTWRTYKRFFRSRRLAIESRDWGEWFHYSLLSSSSRDPKCLLCPVQQRCCCPKYDAKFDFGSVRWIAMFIAQCRCST